jgi:predicted TIM-barrel fold metal-dependent hydrolase
MIIDTHTHLFKKVPYLGEIDREYSPELLIALMDQADVDKAIIISYDLKDILWVVNLIGQVERRIVTKEGLLI